MDKFSALPYTRVDYDTFALSFNSLIDKFKAAVSPEDQASVVAEINHLTGEFETASNLVSIRHSINTLDTFYEKEQEYFDSAWPKVSKLISEYYKALNASPFKEQLAGKFGKQLFIYADLATRVINDAIVQDLQEENRLKSEYEKLIASAAIPFEGEERNLAGLEPFMISPDRDMRKRANAVRWNWLSSRETKLDDIYDKLVKTRQVIATKLGYKTFTPVGYARMRRSDYGPEQVTAFRDAVFEYVVPLVNKIKERQSKRIGISPMKHYDLNFSFKSGNPAPKGNPDWILENGKKMYNELSAETKEFFSFMTEYELMDLVNKKGKSSGGYCTFISKYKAPFIFSNFNGTSHDIDVLTHEAGHAFQVYCSRNFEVEEYYFPTSDAAEIHSMSMEFFTWKWMELFFKEDTDKYKFMHLSSGLQFMPYGVSVDEFQHRVYENPDMSPEQRRAVWREIEKKYTPYKDYDGIEYLEKGGFWQRQAHIYQSPFYYIDYVLAQLCAFQFWIKMQENYDAAWSDYLRLCKAGGSMSFLELVKLANLKSPFEKETIKEVTEKIGAWLDGIDDSKF